MPASRWLVACVALIVGLDGCASAAPTPTPQPGGALTVLAAASLQAPFAELKRAFQASHPRTTLTFAFDASSTLRAQIEQGAPADLLVSADVAIPARLASEGLTAGPPVTFARDTLAIVVPAGNPARISSPIDLAVPSLRIVVAAATVPLGMYTQVLLERLAKEPGYPPGYAARVVANVASREENAATVLTRIELGEADAAILYASQARAAGARLTVIGLPASVRVTASYAAVVLKASRSRPAANDFLAWLRTPIAGAILARFGLTPA
ncbi:MAG: molybdate ABC transporter substrate-binding protein [Chloroflexota bacterium]|nr:molybdate ABC transporter substrate-binding protein [Chloroflexota bacterium]